MKKITSILIAAMMFIHISCYVAAIDMPDDLKEYGSDFDILFKTDMLTTDKYGNFAPQVNLKRSEMCYTLAKMAGISTDSEFDQIFSDVLEETQYWSEINTLQKTGLISGVGDGTFNPDGYVRTQDVLVPIIKLLGYNDMAVVNGGYPTGYTVVAKNHKLLKNVESALGDFVTKLDFARIIKNALDCPLYEIVGANGGGLTKRESDETILSKYHDIVKISGNISANEYAGISRAPVGTEKIAIGNEILSVGDTDAKNYLGYNMDIYYNKNNNQIISLGVNDRCTFYRITDEQEPQFDGTTLSYMKSNGHDTRVSISPKTTILYNLKPVVDITKITGAGNLDNSIIICIDNDGDKKIDTLVINKFQHNIVSYLDIGANMIFFKDETTPVYLDTIEYDFYDFDGNRIEETYVKKGNGISVLESEDGRHIQFFVGDATVTGKVETISAEGIIIDGTEYRLCSGFDQSKLRIGEVMNFQLSIDNKIVGIKEAVVQEKKLNIGYIVDYSYNGDRDRLKINMAINGADSDTVRYFIEDKIKTDGRRMEPAEIYERLEYNKDNGDEPIVIYETDAENNLIKLNTLYHDTNEDEKKEIYESHKYDGFTYKWRSSARMFNIDKKSNNQILLDNDAIAIYAEKVSGVVSECTITGLSLSNDAGYSEFSTYKIGEDSLYDSIVLFNKSGSNSLNFEKYMYPSVIEKITQVWNDSEDEIQSCVVLRTNGVRQEKFIKTGKENNFVFYVDSGNSALRTKYGLASTDSAAYLQLQAGDIVKVSYSVDGKINGGRILFRNSDSAIEKQKLLSDDGGVTTYPELYNSEDFHDEARCLYGYVYDIEDNVLLISKYSPAQIASNGFTKAQMYKTCEKHRIAKEVYTWNESNKAMEKFDVADVEEIYSYCKNGSRASKVFIYSIYSTDYLMMVYK